MNTISLKNKNCLITGATGGIGKEITKCLAMNGCNLFLTSRDTKKLIQLKKECQKITKKKIKISYDTADLSKINDINQIIKKIRRNFSSIDVLVNCAGIFIVKPILDCTVKDFEKSFGVNIRAPFLLCKEFAKDMIVKKWGRIINLGSSSSYSGFKNGTIYCSSKHSILGLSRSLHIELKENNVRTFCVSPSSTKTSMAKISKDQDYNTFLDPKEVAKYIEFVISFDKELISDEIRLNRMIIK